MLNIEIDSKSGIAILRPDGLLSESDFLKASKTIDSYIVGNGRLAGLIISTKEFPGWESFGALVKHIKFVKNHHTEVSKVAIVTDSIIGELAQKVGSHFLSATINHYDFDKLEEAINWIVNG